MAGSTVTRRVMVELHATDGNVEETLDKISAKADELEAKHPELKVQIDKAKALASMAAIRQGLKDEAAKPIEQDIKPKLDDAAAADVVAESKAVGDTAGQSAGGGFSSGFGGMGALIGAGVIAALAALPAAAGAVGGLAGIAFGAQLLIGTKKVQGPLYKQFHEMTATLESVLRVAALPLLKPLADAFAQVGRWAKAMYPEIRAVFASLGPLVAPFARGLERLVSGLLPGFLALMRAAKPAVDAVSGILAQLGTNLGGLFQQLIPGVKSSAQFMQGLGSAISSLLPLVGSLANVAARLLGPIMAQLGGNLLPLVAGALIKVFDALSPLLPPLGRLVAIGLQFSVAPMVGALNTLANMLVQLEGPIQTVANMLSMLASLAQTALSWLSRLPGVGGLFSGTGISLPGMGGIASLVGPVLSGPGLGGGFDAAAAAAGAAYGSNWANGVTDSMVAAAGKTGKAAAKAKAPKIGPALAQGLIQGLQGSPQQIWQATQSILKTIWGDEKAGILTFGEASALAAFVKKDNGRLQALAAQRTAIAKEIAAARQYAAGITSATETTFGLVNSAAGGPNGFLPEANIISNLQEEVRRVRSFAQDIRKLKKMGLNKAYLLQLLQAGPVSGGPIADELANGPLSEISAINAAEKGIESASTDLGQLGANINFGLTGTGGKFLAGLEAQERRVELAMRKLADALVHGVQRELKVEFVGGAGADREFWTWLKRQIRIHGGNPAVVGR